MTDSSWEFRFKIVSLEDDVVNLPYYSDVEEVQSGATPSPTNSVIFESPTSTQL